MMIFKPYCVVFYQNRGFNKIVRLGFVTQSSLSQARRTAMNGINERTDMMAHIEDKAEHDIRVFYRPPRGYWCYTEGYGSRSLKSDGTLGPEV